MIALIESFRGRVRLQGPTGKLLAGSPPRARVRVLPPRGGPGSPVVVLLVAPSTGLLVAPGVVLRVA